MSAPIAEQLCLLPVTPPAIEDRPVALTDLPPNALLVGPAPAKALRDSIARLGVLEPILITASAAPGAPAAESGAPADPAAAYQVIDGRRRVKAARAAALVTIPARLIATAGLHGPTLTLLSHTTRCDNRPAEVMTIRQLLRLGASESQIQAATGLPLPTLRRRLKLAQLPADLFALFSTGQLAAGVAERAARLPAPALAQLRTTWQTTGHLTAEDVRAVQRVQRADDIAALPAALFAAPTLATPPAAPAATAWAADALDQLASLERQLPAEVAPAIRAALEALRALISRSA